MILISIYLHSILEHNALRSNMIHHIIIVYKMYYIPWILRFYGIYVALK
jgi:hypothetical protein